MPRHGCLLAFCCPLIPGRPPLTARVLQILGFPVDTMVILRHKDDGKLLYRQEGRYIHTKFGAEVQGRKNQLSHLFFPSPERHVLDSPAR